MDMKRLAIGTIVGGITSYIAGYLIFDVATIGTYYAANFGIAGAVREVPVQWAIVVSNLAMAAVITYCTATRANAQSIGGGLLSGLTIGFAVWFIADFSVYGYTNLLNLQLAISDPFLSSIPAGAAGAVIAAVLARIPKSAMA
jgi:hypothetical protein